MCRRGEEQRKNNNENKNNRRPTLDAIPPKKKRRRGNLTGELASSGGGESMRARAVSASGGSSACTDLNVGGELCALCAEGRREARERRMNAKEGERLPRSTYLFTAEEIVGDRKSVV